MKKISLIAVIVLTSTFSMAQNSTAWPAGSPAVNPNNSLQAGYIGLGIRPNISSTLLPSYNLHLHGTTNFTVTLDETQIGTLPPSHISTDQWPETGVSVNYGKTTRLGLTNSTTGQSNVDGGVIQMSENDLYVMNREFGSLTLAVPGVSMRFVSSSQRIFVGSPSVSSNSLGAYNIQSVNDNGMFIKTNTVGKYGLAVNVRSNTDAIQVLDSDNAFAKNFKVTGTGEVFARKYTTTLSSIPDYVFAKDYQLMSLTDLKTFITTNQHLPNIPSALEYEKNGVDLGEMNRLLLEKVEELTLYLLQLEERLKTIEGQ